MSNQVLRVNRATVFKLRPEPADSLQPNEQAAIAAGSTYPLHSYAYADINGSFNGHIKFALKDRTINGLNTWFVSSLDAQVEADGVILYPLEDQESMPVLWINRDTVLKRRPLDSTLLPPATSTSTSSLPFAMPKTLSKAAALGLPSPPMPLSPSMAMWSIPAKTPMLLSCG
jgi:hypothetical protein